MSGSCMSLRVGGAPDIVVVRVESHPHDASVTVIHQVAQLTVSGDMALCQRGRSYVQWSECVLELIDLATRQCKRVFELRAFVLNAFVVAG